VIVDAVGVTEHSFVDPPLNREKGVSLKKLLDKAAALTLTEAEAATLASRLAALELQLTNPERAELDKVAGVPVKQIVRGLVDATDPDVQSQAIAAQPNRESAEVIDELIEKAVEPLASNPDLRTRILELHRSHDVVIDEVSKDVLLDAHGVVDKSRAQSIVESWRQYLADHRDEITAIQILDEAKLRTPVEEDPTGLPVGSISKPSTTERISFADIKELADRIARPPHNWTPEVIWAAYEAVDTAQVTHTDKHTLTDLVSLLRFTLGLDSELVPYASQVRDRYANWLLQQSNRGVEFTESQRWWLDRMVEVISVSAGISVTDLDESPFNERGGVDGILNEFGDQAATLIEDLNQELAA
jgi:type I restriction enzyme R subunit